MRLHFRGMLVAGGLWVACGAGVCLAQNAPPNPAPCTVAPQPVPCSATSATPAQSGKPNTADKFPFPGEGGAPGDTTKSPAVPAAPGAATDPAAKKQAGADFPFPGEDAKPGLNTTPGESSSSSGDDPTPADPGTTPDAAGLKDKGSEGSATPQRHLLHRVNPPGTKLQSADEREAEDLSVAHFYTQSGDLKGAYLRTQDAVKTAPDDPDAHFALAETALKLNKRDEAIAEYTACLKLDPDDKEAKAAHKELARLKP
jgi:TolA-binding protein